MKFYKRYSKMAAVLLTAVVMAGCAAGGEENQNKDTNGNLLTQAPALEDSWEYGGDADDIVAFRPVDCGVQAQKEYEYPFLGLKIQLTDSMLGWMDERDIFVFTDENYTADASVSYAVLRFSATTEEQKLEEGMSVDIFSWEEALDKVGAIGVYKKDVTGQMDVLTFCDTHQKIGESADGEYEYYLSTCSQGNAEYIKELEASSITFGEMHELDLAYGYTAFSMDRPDGVATVGTFTTEDVFGNNYTQELFSEHDLTLVNIMTTWCTYCVEEMPVLEQLRQEYADKERTLGVVTYIMDIETAAGRDDSALALAQRLAERSGAAFPLLIPDEGKLNGRLTGVESFPETFFVDKNGTIVSEPYLGARNLKAWEKIVEEEFAKMEADN